MRMRLPAVLLLLLCCWLPPVLGQRARADLLHQGEPIVIEADELVRESADRWVAAGEVIIRYQEMVLRSPRLTYNPLTGDLAAEGPLELTRGIQWLKGSAAQLNLRTHTGTVQDAEGFTDGELYVKAARLIQTGPRQYEAVDGFLTACQEAVPKWSFTVNRAQIPLGGNARFTHTLFKVRKIPVFYLPLMLFPTAEKQRSSGFLIPSTGNSNNKGRRISQSFYLVLGRSADLTLHGDYFSERGFGHGVTFRTRPDHASSLELHWYRVDDRKNQGGSLFNGIGQTRLPHGFRAVADFNLVSNFTFRQVFSDNFFTATQPTENSRVFISNNHRSRSFNFLVSREETVFPGPNVVIRNLPTIHFSLSGQRLGRTPLLFDLDASAEGRSRSDRFFETPTVTQRLDFFPQFYFSAPLFQGLRITPRVGFRNTFYSDSLRPVSGEGEDPVTGENIQREYFQLTLDLNGWGLSRVYGDPKKGRTKHVLEPFLRYRYLTGLDEFDRIIRFDEQDAIVNTNEVEYALWNRIFVKRQVEGQAVNHEWLSFKLAQKHFFDPDFDGALREGQVNQFFPLNTLTGFPFGGRRRNFSPILALLRFSPQPGYSFDVRGDFDPDFHTFRNFSITGFLNRPNLYLGTTYFLTRELEPGTFKSNQLQMQAAVGKLERGLSVSSIFSYDARSDRFLTYRTRLNYAWDCCSVSLEYQGFNVGVRQEQQVRFSFFLKGLGTFGTIRRPDSLF